ncbi:MAG: 30S ribosomal protein S20 [Bacilli bacterium]|nr:30S ribosomal protein S20 [Bacilli bacterium]MDD4282271.1 30S ribosomal protein S20 [Bacilli bacterium]MDD4718417.1 30S ribosomal protein S20 [Bacilli bacterium]
MPNLKNATKKVKVIATKKQSNNEYKASMRTAIKNVDKAITENNKEKANDSLNVAIKKIDKATKKGVIHANKGARDKSKLTKKVNVME